MTRVSGPTESLLWYASYGSNLLEERFTVYLTGGTPAGGRRATPGCRDQSPPRENRAIEVPGGIFFATESLIWGGGRAFYDPARPTVAAMRAYLITTSQFADVVAQEMYAARREIDLAQIAQMPETGRWAIGPGRYETLLRLPSPDGRPMVTFTCPWRAGEVPGVAPSTAYLQTLARGLSEAHGWPPERIAEYLAEAMRT